LAKPWLYDFLQVLMGAAGNINFNADGSFEITVRNEHHTGAIAAAKQVELMSADLPRTNAAVAQRFGCDADEVFLFEVDPEQASGHTVAQPSPVKTCQVASLGAMGRQRGESFETAKQALVQELERRNPGRHRHYDLKGFERHKTHFLENRSDNEPFEAGVTSISMTLPRPSLKGLLSEYCTLTGNRVGFDDPGFQEYYQDAIRELIQQTRGRFREQWRPSEEELTLYIICDEELPIEVDEVISAAEITDKAAVGREELILKLPHAIATLAIEGTKLTQQVLAEMLNCTQARISQILSTIPGGWKLFKRVWGCLLENPQQNINSAIEATKGIYKTEIQGEELAILVQLLTTMVEMYRAGTATADEVVKDVTSMALSLGSKTWRAVAASLPPELRDILKSIIVDALPRATRWIGSG
jgi:hypothetical protein